MRRKKGPNATAIGPQQDAVSRPAVGYASNMRRRVVAVIAGASFALAACNALTGVGDLGVGGAGDGRGGEGGSDGGGTIGEGGAGGGDGASDEDSGVPVDPTIPVVTPSLASCGTDLVCLSTRDGWSPALQVLGIFGGSTACPASWPITKTYEKSGGGSCKCACTPSAAGSCSGTIQARGGAACTGAPTTLAVGTDGTCVAMAAGLPAPVALRNTGSPPSSCSGAVTNDLNPPKSSIGCSGATPTPSAACAASEVCVPKPPKGQFGIPTAQICMAHDGLAGCPTNLPLRIVAGSSVKDSRSCESACACGPRPCTGTLEGFGTAACSGNALKSWNVDGTCATSAVASPATSFRYTASSPCEVKVAPKVVGMETIDAPRTFCCTSSLFGGD